MNSAIALGIKPLEIPSQAEGMQRALTLEALMGQNDLQRQKLANAPRELALAEAKAGQDARSSQLGIEGKQQELMSTLAASIANAPPEQQAAIYPQMAAEWKRLGLPNSEKVPDQWNPEMLPHLQAIASRGQTVDKQQENANYRALGGPQAAPAPSNTYSALAGEGSVSPPVSPNLSADQESAAWDNRSMTMPVKEVTEKREGIAPDDYRKEAARLQSMGTKQAFDQAKVYLDEAERMDNRIGREEYQAEQIRVREEAIATRHGNQSQKTREFENKLGDDFKSEEPVKRYRKVQPLISSMEEASKKDTAGSDLNMVYAIASIFDPDSVVREGEQIMIRNAGGLPSVVQSALGFVIGGQRLSPELRKEILEEGRSRVGGLKQAHDSLAGSYRRQAEEQGLNPSNVVRTYDIKNSGRRSTDGKDSGWNDADQKRLDELEQKRGAK